MDGADQPSLQSALPTSRISSAASFGPASILRARASTNASHRRFPLACAAGLATLDTYADGDLLTRAARLQDEFAQALHSLRDEPNVIDVRNIGLVGGIELKPLDGQPAKRAFNVFLDCWDKGLLIRTTGDTIALSPPLIIESSHIERIIDTLRGALRRAA